MKKLKYFFVVVLGTLFFASFQAKSEAYLVPNFIGQHKDTAALKLHKSNVPYKIKILGECEKLTVTHQNPKKGYSLNTENEFIDIHVGKKATLFDGSNIQELKSKGVKIEYITVKKRGKPPRTSNPNEICFIPDSTHKLISPPIGSALCKNSKITYHVVETWNYYDCR